MAITWEGIWETVKDIWNNTGIMGTINGLMGNKKQIYFTKNENGETEIKETTRNEQEQAKAMQKEQEKEMNQKTENIENPNLENKINGMDITSLLEQSKKWRDEAWAREDAIRAETQAREDNAIQRKVADMRASGVNPNLAYSMSGADSGGGITNATGIDTSLPNTELGNISKEEISKYEKEMEKILKEWEVYLDQNFKGSENSKDRANDLIAKIISIAGILMLAG